MLTSRDITVPIYLHHSHTFSHIQKLYAALSDMACTWSGGLLPYKGCSYSCLLSKVPPLFRREFTLATSAVWLRLCLRFCTIFIS
ncbi:hypothetical protein ILYODFUR_007227 [Ilyodon furcidens]|uniref:Uncharacterized protein n=1 Tax=Ilyodon furcidens TaxID=33524 RepID=A0ABV0UFE4_9TELE